MPRERGQRAVWATPTGAAAELAGPCRDPDLSRWGNVATDRPATGDAVCSASGPTRRTSGPRASCRRTPALLVPERRHHDGPAGDGQGPRPAVGAEALLVEPGGSPLGELEPPPPAAAARRGATGRDGAGGGRGTHVGDHGAAGGARDGRRAPPRAPPGAAIGQARRHFPRPRNLLLTDGREPRESALPGIVWVFRASRGLGGVHGGPQGARHAAKTPRIRASPRSTLPDRPVRGLHSVWESETVPGSLCILQTAGGGGLRERRSEARDGGCTGRTKCRRLPPPRTLPASPRRDRPRERAIRSILGRPGRQCAEKRAARAVRGHLQRSSHGTAPPLPPPWPRRPPPPPLADRLQQRRRQEKVLDCDEGAVKFCQFPQTKW